MGTTKRQSVLFAAAMTTCVRVALSNNLTWDGNGANEAFTTSQNWVANVAPVAGDSLFFDGLIGLSPQNDLATGTTFSGITFNGSAGAFTIAGNAITLQNGIADNSSQLQTISLPVTYDGTNSVAVNAAATLNVGQLNRTAGGVINFTLPAGGKIITSTANTNGILGGWTTVANADFAANDGNGNIVPYTGYTNYLANQILHSTSDATTNLQIVSPDTVLVDNDNANSTTDVNTIVQRDPTDGNIKIGAGNTLRLGQIGAILVPPTVVSESNPWTISASGVGSATQGGATLTAGGAPNTAGQIIINTNGISSLSNLNVDATIADNGSGTVTVVKTGPGSIKFRGHNSYSGGTYIEQGRLQLSGKEDVGGTANGDGLGSGPVYVSPGAQVFVSDVGSTIPNDFYLSGTGIPSENSGAVRTAGVFTGNMHLVGNTLLNGNVVTGYATFTGQITDSGKGYDLSILGEIAIGNTTANPNSWNNTIISKSTSVRLLADEQIPDGPGKGNFINNGAFDLNGHSETINGLSGFGGFGSTTAATLTLGGNNQTAVSTGGASGATSLVKIGNGMQTLSGSDTTSGFTIINAGTLSIGSANMTGTVTVNSSAMLAGVGTFGKVTVNSGAHISPGSDNGIGNIATLSTTGVTVNAADIDVDLAATTSDVFKVNGAATFSGTSTITPQGLPSAGTYAILTATSLSGLNTATITVNPLPTLPHMRATSIAVNTTSTAVNLVVTGGGRNTTWTGSQNSNWDYPSQNWTDSIAVGTETFFDGDKVMLPDLADASKRNITLTSDIQPGSVTVFNSGSNTYTLSGNAIVGLGKLTKDGPSANAGTLIVANDNSYAGGTTLNHGVIQVGNGTTSGSLGLGSVLINSGTLIFNRSDASTFDNTINGFGNVVKAGSGTLTLTGSSSFQGVTYINAGELIATNNHALGDTLSSTSSVVIASGAAFNSTSANLGNKQFIVQGSGPDGNGVITGGPSLGSVALTGDSTFQQEGNFTLIVNSGTLDLGGYTLTKLGGGTFELNGTTVTAGNININGGMLELEGTLQMPAASGTIQFAAGTNLQLLFAGGTIARSMGFSGDSTIFPSSTSTLASNITFAGDLTFLTTFANAGTVILNGSVQETSGSHNVLITGQAERIVYNATNAYSGTTTISGGTLQLGSGAAATSGNLGSGDVIDNGNLVFNRANTLTINNNISGSGNLYQTGSGTTILGGALSYTGSTNVSAGTLITNTNFIGGTLNITGGFAQVLQKPSANSPAGTSVVKGLSIATGSTLDLTNNSMVIDYTSIGTLDTDIRLHLLNNRLISSIHTSSTTLAYADNAVLGLTSFSGVSVDSTSLLIKYTYGGDSNLDGKVDVTDLGALASHWQQSGDWLAGDFNYDGTVNVTDLGILAGNWQTGVGNPLAQDSFQQALTEVGLGNVFVPEPATLAAILLFMLPLNQRSRCKRRASRE